MYMPLCGEELDVQSRMVPSWSIPIPQTAHARPEGLGCLRRYVGSVWKVKHTLPPRGAPLCPKERAKTRGTQAYVRLCGEELEVQTRVASP